jgi:hypothetical protein
LPESTDDTDAIPFATPLTRKQTAFVDAVISSGFEHGSIISAYRSAYDSHGGTDNTHSVEAWRLLNNPKVARRLQDAANAQGATTDRIVSGILERTEDATTSAAVALNGYELLAKITGLLSTTPASTTAAASYQQNNISVTAGALAEILTMIAAPSADDGVQVIDGQGGIDDAAEV